MVFRILYLLIHHNKFIKGVIIKQIKNFLLLLLIFLFMQSLNAKTINVAFINGRDNVGFWKDVENFMLEVAKDFETVHHLRERISFYLQSFLEECRPNKIKGVFMQESLDADIEEYLGVTNQNKTIEKFNKKSLIIVEKTPNKVFDA